MCVLLTAEGRWHQFALVHTVDRAEGVHDSARAEAVEHLACLDERFANPTACKFTVCLRQGSKVSQHHHHHDRIIKSQWISYITDYMKIDSFRTFVPDCSLSFM